MVLYVFIPLLILYIIDINNILDESMNKCALNTYKILQGYFGKISSTPVTMFQKIFSAIDRRKKKYFFSFSMGHWIKMSAFVKDCYCSYSFSK